MIHCITTRLGGVRQQQLAHAPGPCPAFRPAAAPGPRTTRREVTLTLAPRSGLPAHNHRPETRVSTPPGRNEGAATVPRRTASQMLTAICNPDQRAVDPNLRRLAATVPAGQPIPDPNHARARYLAVMDAAADYLRDQPSGRTVRSAGLHLHRGLTGLVNDIAGRKAC